MKNKYVFLAIAVVFLIILSQRGANDLPFAQSFSTALGIVGSVFALLVAGAGVAWVVHKKREAQRLENASKDV